jgi:hypothetical protein
MRDPTLRAEAASRRHSGRRTSIAFYDARSKQ